MTPFTLPIPTYQCHKRVRALRIKAVVENPRGYELHFEDERFCPIEFACSGIAFYPEAGRYLVFAEGKPPTCIDASAFEAGYTLLSAGDFTPDQVSAAEADARAWSAFQYEWPGGPSEVDAALASRDAEIERLRTALENAKSAQLAGQHLDLHEIAEALAVGPATQAAREVGK